MSTAFELTDLDYQAIAVAKALAADAVEKAGSGHPGTAISLAPVAYTLYQFVMRHDPSDPTWLGRDRFVLSSGHASLLLYVQLFLAGYRIELDDLKQLRQAGSLLPGHPEYRHTPGVEMTTGPLGQGFAAAVGMALAARRERHLFDPETQAGSSPFDHTIWVVAGDGDLQEGVAAEASSLAGTQQLGNLVVLYDQNQISIEGDTSIALTEDVLARYRAYGWHTQTVDWRGGDAYVEDLPALYEALQAAKAQTSQPSIIALQSVIGWPAPTKQNSGAIHGAKLGETELAGLKEALGLDPQASFAVPREILAHTRRARLRAQAIRDEWEVAYAGWRAGHPDRAWVFDRLDAGRLPSGWTNSLPVFEAGTAVSTRKASGEVLTAIAPALPELWGGSADLAESNLTTMVGQPSVLPTDTPDGAWPGGPGGRVLHFGIREHAMGQILNGITLHGPTRAFGGTFLVFSDYMRPALRAAALMGLDTLFVWSHDSIGVGEDGPTHQPIEHLAALRAIPGFDVVRPADANETAAAWQTMLERHGRPAGIILSRQNLPVWSRISGPGSGGDPIAVGEPLADVASVARGAYVLAEAPAGTKVDVLLIATGSEVQHALGARALLAQEGIGARVVSAPCLEWFADQDQTYRDSVLPPRVTARVSVEAGLGLGWRELVGPHGQIVSIDHFGAGGSGDALMSQYGFTRENVVVAAKAAMDTATSRSMTGLG